MIDPDEGFFTPQFDRTTEGDSTGDIATTRPDDVDDLVDGQSSMLSVDTGIRPKPLVVSVVAVFTDQFRSRSTPQIQRVFLPQLFECRAYLRVATVDLFGGDPQDELITRLIGARRDSIDFVHEILGNVELDFGHLARVSRGFG